MPTKSTKPKRKTQQQLIEEAVAERTQALVDRAVADAVAATRASLVAAESKPDLIRHLRETWRKDAAHAAEQVRRFVRLTFLAAMPSLIDLLIGGDFDKTTLVAFILPFAEVAYRQMFPALEARGADDAQGVTIVPSQVGAPTADVPVDVAEVEVQLPEGTPEDVVADVADAVEGDAAP